MKDPHLGSSPNEQPLVPADENVAVSAERESIAGLFRRLIDDITDLIRSELQLARTEVTANVSAGAVGAGLAFAGALLALVAVTLLLVAFIIWLAEHVGLLMATLGVGLAMAAIAALLVITGIGKVRQMSLAPKRTTANLKRDAEMLKGD